MIFVFPTRTQSADSYVGGSWFVSALNLWTESPAARTTFGPKHGV
jgi:hypothetical protein